MEVDYVTLIQNAKKNEKDLVLVLSLFQPLIKKYAKRLFFMEKEDAEQELNIALIEAVKGIIHCEHEGKCIKYIENAVRYKFIFLCRKNQNRLPTENFEDDTLDKIGVYETYEDVEAMYDLEQQKRKLPQKQQQILDYIIIGYKDKQIGEKMGVSRQYINRVKKQLFRKLTE